MNRKLSFCIIFFFSFSSVFAQYQFTDVHELRNTSVKNQQKTGTCWSFATGSFIESELLRKEGIDRDLSEMYIVRKIYLDKARNYVLRQGKANFSQGSLSHDFVRAIARYGVVPESVYSGKEGAKHDHTELFAVLKAMLDAVIAQKRPSAKWPKAIEAVLDVYLGEVRDKFVYGGREYDPKGYAKSLNLRLLDYVSLTSFTHHPFYSRFILEIPDNYSNQSYYNLPMDEFQGLVDKAIETGYTVAWDGDVSEKGFSSKHGIAVLSVKPERKDLFKKPGAEREFSVESRQRAFENYSTTDDHLMHIVGIARDQRGTKYYKVKNSWGKRGAHKGYIYMSETYFKMKTVGVMLNRAVIPEALMKKLGL